MSSSKGPKPKPPQSEPFDADAKDDVQWDGAFPTGELKDPQLEDADSLAMMETQALDVNALQKLRAQHQKELAAQAADADTDASFEEPSGDYASLDDLPSLDAPRAAPPSAPTQINARPAHLSTSTARTAPVADARDMGSSQTSETSVTGSATEADDDLAARLLAAVDEKAAELNRPTEVEAAGPDVSTNTDHLSTAIIHVDDLSRSKNKVLQTHSGEGLTHDVTTSEEGEAVVASNDVRRVMPLDDGAPSFDDDDAVDDEDDLYDDWSGEGAAAGFDDDLATSADAVGLQQAPLASTPSKDGGAKVVSAGSSIPIRAGGTAEFLIREEDLPVRSIPSSAGRPLLAQEQPVVEVSTWTMGPTASSPKASTLRPPAAQSTPPPPPSKDTPDAAQRSMARSYLDDALGHLDDVVDLLDDVSPEVALQLKGRLLAVEQRIKRAQTALGDDD